MRGATIAALILLGGGAALSRAEEQAPRLRYGDGAPDGKRSLSGSGELIEFTAATDMPRVSGLRVHGSRYGLPDPPPEHFLIFFLNADRSEVLRTELAPYSRFERGPDQWVEIPFRRPVALPRRFWVALDFHAGRSKGVYVSYDTSTEGQHSRVGLPGTEAKETDFGGDWMIEALLSN